MPQVLDQRGYPVPGVFRHKPGYGQSVAYTGTAGVIANTISDTYATATLTSTGVAPSDGDTVTCGGVTYTFKTILTPTAGEVLINGSAANALVNLGRAINHTGTPGTDYANAGTTAVANPQVSAGTPTATALVITSLLPGVVGNSYLTSEVAVTLSWGSTAMSGGLENARNTRFIRVLCTTAAFVRIGVSPTAVATDYAMTANVAETFACNPGDKVSAVQVASGGTMYVAELD